MISYNVYIAFMIRVACFQSLACHADGAARGRLPRALEARVVDGSVEPHHGMAKVGRGLVAICHI